MESANRLSYGDKINYYEGVVVDVRDGLVTLDVLGRLGWFEVSDKMFTADYPLKRGQSLGWKMSFVEQLKESSSYECESMGDGINYMEATVSDVDDCAVEMSIMNGLGKFKTPMRMLISDNPFEIGQRVGWNMTKFVQLGPEVNEKYVSNIQNRERRATEISSINT